MWRVHSLGMPTDKLEAYTSSILTPCRLLFSCRWRPASVIGWMCTAAVGVSAVGGRFLAPAGSRSLRGTMSIGGAFLRWTPEQGSSACARHSNAITDTVYAFCGRSGAGAAGACAVTGGAGCRLATYVWARREGEGYTGALALCPDGYTFRGKCVPHAAKRGISSVPVGTEPPRGRRRSGWLWMKSPKTMRAHMRTGQRKHPLACGLAMVPSTGFEPATFRSGGERSDPLS